MNIINCSNPNQLSDFVTHMIPKIWNGNTPLLMSSNRSNAFRKFCQNIIKSTQLSSSCILVALFYIYKLRFSYPSIEASIGSEVRLFTTALMLANKFLDDNTFTNKTWSEVSNVPLHELNIMEMEFLGALNYRTRIHHKQFYSWASQCQYWMSQIFSSQPSVQNFHKRKQLHYCKKSIHHPYYHPYSQKYQPVSVLNWPSTCPIPSYTTTTSVATAAAASVATVAAATAAMNLNCSSFIPRVTPH